MEVDDLLDIAFKVEHGIKDTQSTASEFRPLWQHPLVHEAFVAMLHAIRDDQPQDFARRNFEIICNLLCPEFAGILSRVSPAH